MAKIIQRNFAAGEISPDLASRSDFVSYQNGLQKAKNVYVLRQGGLASRPGTKFHGRAKYGNRKCRLIDFEFSDSDSIIIEFGHQYLRFYDEGNVILSPSIAIESIDNSDPGSPAVIGIESHNLFNGDEIVLNITFTNGSIVSRNAIMANATFDTFEVVDLYGQNIQMANLGTFVSGTIAKIYEVNTTIQEADLFDFNYDQSADVMTFVHPDYGVFDLKRFSNNNWTFLANYLHCQSKKPNPFVVLVEDVGNTGTKKYRYAVTILDQSGNESFPVFDTIEGVRDVATTNGSLRMNIGSDVDQEEIPTSFNIYRGEYFDSVPQNDDYSGLGFLVNVEAEILTNMFGTFSSAFFVDQGLEIDTSKKPPLQSILYGQQTGLDFDVNNEDDFDFTNLYPAAIALSKQRRFFGGSNSDPETVWGSRVAQYSSFTTVFPGLSVSTDPVKFTNIGGKVGRIKHLFDFKRLFIFTDSAEYIAQGGDSGEISAIGLPNTEKISNHGITNLEPLLVDQNVLFVQARGSIVRSIGGQITLDDYQGDEVSLFSSHLVDGYQLVDWCYQKTPHSIVWICRNDGKVLSLTYNMNHQIKGWCQHEFFNGQAESVINVSEGVNDQTYFSVKRTINGVTHRYIESFNTVEVFNTEDLTIMDSHLTYDGRNKNLSHTMELNEISGWTSNDEVELISSTAYFNAGSVDEQIHLNLGTEFLRVQIVEYVSPTIVKVIPLRNVPVSLQNVLVTDWSRAVKEISGLYHLEGLAISVFADGLVLSSPLNNNYDIISVVGGRAILPNYVSYAHFGIPIVSDIVPLNIDSAGRTDTLADKNFNSTYVGFQVKNTFPMYVGSDEPTGSDFLEGLNEAKLRQYEDYQAGITPKTGIIELTSAGRWKEGGNVFVRQVDPVPLRILSMFIDGHFGG